MKCALYPVIRQTIRPVILRLLKPLCAAPPTGRAVPFRKRASAPYPVYRTLWQQIPPPFNRSSVLTCVSPSVRAVYLYQTFSCHYAICITEFQHFLSFVFVDQNDASFRTAPASPGTYFFAALGLLAPYLERACFLFATPAVSRVPRIMWYLVPGKSFTLPPRTRTTLCSCRLCPSPGI